MVLTALVIYWMMKLQCSGNVSSASFIGCTGIVYLTIPAGDGTGKVTVTLKSSTHELRACAGEELPTGTRVEVIREISNGTFLVKKSL
jgi:membrane protein implicated in regulation of membrane protease activity